MATFAPGAAAPAMQSDDVVAGAPLRSGAVSESTLAAGALAQETAHGVDNRAVHVWRP